LGCLATEQPIGIARRCDALANLNRAVDAAVDDDRLAGEVAGLQRAEIGAEIADFIRPPQATHRDSLREALELLVGRDASSVRPSGQDVCEAISQDGTGRDIVDGDAVRRGVRRNRLGHDRDARAHRIGDDEIRHRLLHAGIG
jgi:hypothetical protein